MSAVEMAVEQAKADRQSEEMAEDQRNRRLSEDIAALLEQGSIVPEDPGEMEPIRYGVSARAYLHAHHLAQVHA